MAREIVEVKEEEPKKKKKSIDFNKVGEVVKENKGTIAMILGALLTRTAKKSKTTKKSTSKKTSSKSKNKTDDELSDAVDLFSKLLKK